MAHAVLCGLFFGLVGLFVGGVVAEETHLSNELTGVVMGASGSPTQGSKTFRKHYQSARSIAELLGGRVPYERKIP